MSNIANLVDATGEPKVLITPYYVNNALAVMRDFEAQSMDGKPGKSSKVVLLTFDDVMLAAALLATVERSYCSSGYLCYFIGALVAAGFGDPGAAKGHFESWMAKSNRNKPNSVALTKVKAGTKIARAA